MVWSIFQPFFSAFSASFTKKTVHMVVVIGPDGRNPRNPKNRTGMGVNLPTIPMRNPSGSSYKPQHTINSQFPFLLVKTCHNHIYLVKSHKHIKTNYKHIFYIILQYIITNRTSGTFLYYLQVLSRGMSWTKWLTKDPRRQIKKPGRHFSPAASLALAALAGDCGASTGSSGCGEEVRWESGLYRTWKFI